MCLLQLLPLLFIECVDLKQILCPLSLIGSTKWKTSFVNSGKMPPPKLCPYDYISPTCDLDLISRNPFFKNLLFYFTRHSGSCDAPQVEQFRRYLLDKDWTHEQIAEHSDSSAPPKLQKSTPQKYIRKHSTKTNTMAERGHEI